jgi:serine/threonine-protein kinase
MGEVYRAHDKKLGRDVAIKVLPEALSADAERVERFQREARTLAALNHPNIAAIYGLEHAGGVTGLVLELVDGPTLADRIAAGPIPVVEALKIATQLADGLEAAHEQGIIHRDLKPANIKLRSDGTVKVLDFGLAKALAADASRASTVVLTNSPTITSPIEVSGVGVLLGTAPYMSPEQARGKSVDKRSDIWAFGCVLYEMLTGSRPFDGEDVSLTLAAIVKSEPDFRALPPELPSPVRVCLGRCLEKDPKQRMRDMGDVRLAIGGAFEPLALGNSAAGPRRGARAMVAVALVAIAVAAASIGVAIRLGGTRNDEPPRIARFAVALPPDAFFRDGVAEPLRISADGRRVVFNVRQRNVDRVFTRALDELDTVQVRGLEGNVGSVFLSPNGEWIGFYGGVERTLNRIRATGGSPTLICRTAVSGAPGFRGATWGTAGTIVFATAGAPALMQVSESGGVPKPATIPADGETHQSPHFLPDGRRLLFTIQKRGEPDHIALLDHTGVRRLVQGSSPRYATTGHILFVRDGIVWAAPFDLERGAVSGNPAPVLEDVEIFGGAVARLALATNGTLVYVPGPTGVGQRSLVWVDRSGREEALAAPPRPYTWVRVSPDGTRIAMEVQDPANTDIWTYDVRRGTFERFTVAAGHDRWPLWTPDGQRIVFASGTNLMWKAANGTGAAELFAAGLPFPARPYDWSRDKLGLVYDQENVSSDLFFMAPNGKPEPQPLVVNEFRNHRPAVSPDGRWIAYTSNETGREEIYVRPFPAVGSGRWRISTDGAISPVWSPDGRELLYSSPLDDAIFHVSIEAGTTFKAGIPKMLFRKPYYWGLAAGGRPFDIGPDGRLLMIKEHGVTNDPPSIRVVLNWHEELKRLVPTSP